MLQLNAEQVQRLEAIALERDLRRMGQLLARAFPDIAARLGERYGLLLTRGMQCAAAHQLFHALCVARYLACWFMLGVEFENKPGMEWALAILSDTKRAQGAKVFQLCRRTREELGRLAKQPTPVAGLMTVTAFDAAIGQLDAALAERGPPGSLLPGTRLKLGEPCDIDAVDVRLVDAGWRHQYSLSEGQWRRLPCTPEVASVTLNVATAGAPTAGVAGAVMKPPGAPAPSNATLPAQISLIAHPPGRDGARLKVRVRAATCCDAQVHPLVSFNTERGLSEWRGPQTQEIVLTLQALPAEPAAQAGPLPTIAVESTPTRSVLALAACGMRDAGATLGDQQTQLAVYPAEQHLLVWRREAGRELSFPEPSGSAPTAAPARCRIERDGVPIDASRWQAGLEDLDRQLAEGLGRLHAAWERESGVHQATLHAEPSVLAGEAALTWGYSEGPQGVLSTPYLRLVGRIDLIACRLNLRLGGQLALRGSLSRLNLQSHGSETLQAAWQRHAGEAELLPPQTPVQATVRQPFVLQIESLAQAELAVLGSSPVSGAIVGSCGLRPRPEGAGLQWFATLAIEPVDAKLQWLDPLLGTQDLPRRLLPDMKLLDWSLG